MVRDRFRGMSPVIWMRRILASSGKQGVVVKALESSLQIGIHFAKPKQAGLYEVVVQEPGYVVQSPDAVAFAQLESLFHETGFQFNRVLHVELENGDLDNRVWDVTNDAHFGRI